MIKFIKLALTSMYMGLYAGKASIQLHLFSPEPNSSDMSFLHFPKIMDNFKPKTTFSRSLLS